MTSISLKSSRPQISKHHRYSRCQKTWNLEKQASCPFPNYFFPRAVILVQASGVQSTLKCPMRFCNPPVNGLAVISRQESHDVALGYELLSKFLVHPSLAISSGHNTVHTFCLSATVMGAHMWLLPHCFNIDQKNSHVHLHESLSLRGHLTGDLGQDLSELPSPIRVDSLNQHGPNPTQEIK